MMHYTTELLDDNTLLFRFTVPAEEYTAALDEAWRTHKARYPVPGMRDGQPHHDRAASRQRCV